MKIRPLLLLIALVLLPTFLHAQGYRGKDFWLVFPENAKLELNRVQRISVYIAAERRTTGRIEFSNGLPPIPVSVEAGASASYDLDTLLELTQIGMQTNKSAHLRLDNDASVYVIEHRNASTDSYMAIPTDLVGNQYAVLGYAPLGSSNVSFRFTSEAGIVATDDNTIVSIRLSDSIMSYSDARELYPKGRTLMFVLERGQSIMFASDRQTNGGDITGSVVTASKPIGFVTGHRCAQVPSNASFCDVLLEMEPPTTKLGTDFLVPAFAEKSTYVTRVLAIEDSTNVTMNGRVVQTLRQGQFWESLKQTNDLWIETSRPALVAQYCTSSLADSTPVGDPFMLLVTPKERFVKEATAVTLTTGEWDHFVSIVTRREDLSDLRLDGNAIPVGSTDGLVKYLAGNRWSLASADAKAVGDATDRHQSIAAAPNAPYVVVRMQIAKGRHTISSSKPFAAYEYGFGRGVESYDSYGNTCGEDLRQ